MEMWGVTEQELVDLAMENSEYMTHTMLDIMLETMEGLDDVTIQMMNVDPTLKQQIIVTNKERLFGASAIYKKEILKEIADQFRSDIYIIPSSIHELIIIPSYVISAEEVTAQIQTVNATDVDPEDVLSDHVYIFRRETMEIEY